jgi:hypothetical protein
MNTSITFEDDVPFPMQNIEVYRRLYIIELWLRRFVLAGLMSKYGTQWRSAIPTDLSKAVRPRRAALAGRAYLDVEASDNVVWLMTLEELRQLLISEFIWPSVRELTSLQREETAAKLEELREIRNVIGHNRAITDQTVSIFGGIEDYLHRGIARFKAQTLDKEFADKTIFTAADPADVVSAAVGQLCDGTLRQVFLERTDKFNAVISLPVPPFGYVSVADLLEAFHNVRDLILALYVNATANEFSVVWPLGATVDEHLSVVEHLGYFLHYTEEPYSAQDPKYVCDPRIWFY